MLAQIVSDTKGGTLIINLTDVFEYDKPLTNHTVVDKLVLI